MKLQFTEATENFIIENKQKCNYNINRLIDEANGQRSIADNEDIRQEFITIVDELNIIKEKDIFHLYI